VKFLLDTCVISELASKRPEPRVVTWIDGIDPDRIYLSVVTVGEIQKGIEKLKDPLRRERLESWLRDDLLVRFRDRLVELDLKAMLEWGTLTGRLESEGTPMPAVDSLIAASALLGGFVLVTRNEEDFIRSGVQILNPWN
jgi:toxin FitB